MITRRMEDKLEELKSYFNTKFNEHKESLIKTFNNVIVFRNNVNSYVLKIKY